MVPVRELRARAPDFTKLLPVIFFRFLAEKPGKETREGSDIARMVVGVRHDNCPVIVDVGGGSGAAALGQLECNVLVQGQSFAEIAER
jgi:hypothetical protein